MNAQSNICPVCGASALTEKHDHSFFFNHGRKLKEVPNLSQTLCSACGVSMFLPSQLKENNRRVKDFQAKLEDYISPEQILELREKYKITQVDANKIFGGGPTAFSKYERGLSNPTASASRQMLAALRDPSFMRSVADSRGVRVNVCTPIESCEALIDTLPLEIRSQVEEYAGNLRISRWDGCVALLKKGLDVTRTKSAEEWGQEAGVNYALDYEYVVQSYDVAQKQYPENRTKTKFVTPIRKTSKVRGQKNA
ncbi:type II toxin-antitoxin system MqsA family antitoxin [Massilia sp. IC2-278]|uniref:type II TA system antitoxin MqsA family protein n=1 Tax=Massilia sp. IC2-278 TaxID=2887200 RepID=UPI001E344B64|nr:type II TA system antitoxin MqsA family protein [Massilia sp. IC2-278]MCC2960948.1 type II toxin-antitoxin system MqsA family antitoxin [Massilia sp. IC2-278]